MGRQVRKGSEKRQSRKTQKNGLQVVVNTNILFSFFKEDSTTKELFLLKKISLNAPTFALEEIQKYKNVICKKNKLTEEEFRKTMSLLLIIVHFFPSNTYKNNMNIQSPDTNDVDFLALAKTLNQPLWTHDKKLMEQQEVRILSTKMIIESVKFP